MCYGTVKYCSGRKLASLLSLSCHTRAVVNTLKHRGYGHLIERGTLTYLSAFVQPRLGIKSDMMILCLRALQIWYLCLLVISYNQLATFLLFLSPQQLSISLDHKYSMGMAMFIFACMQSMGVLTLRPLGKSNLIENKFNFAKWYWRDGYHVIDLYFNEDFISFVLFFGKEMLSSDNLA